MRKDEYSSVVTLSQFNKELRKIYFFNSFHFYFLSNYTSCRAINAIFHEEHAQIFNFKPPA
jgi:hypothetical protein